MHTFPRIVVLDYVANNIPSIIYLLQRSKGYIDSFFHISSNKHRRVTPSPCMIAMYFLFALESEQEFLLCWGITLSLNFFTLSTMLSRTNQTDEVHHSFYKKKYIILSTIITILFLLSTTNIL